MDQQFCPKCGTQISGEAAFCNHCGAHLATPPQAVSASSPEPAATAPPRFDTVSPQYVAVMEMNYPKAGIGNRLIASIIDTCIILLPGLPGIFLLASDTLEIIGGIWLVIAGCWAVFYSFCKDGFGNGQSYGKKMNGQMVVSLATNEPCSKGKSALRALSFYIPYVGSLIEIVMVLATDKGRRLGDKLAGTQVIEVTQYKR